MRRENAGKRKRKAFALRWEEGRRQSLTKKSEPSFKGKSKRPMPGGGKSMKNRDHCPPGVFDERRRQRRRKKKAPEKKNGKERRRKRSPRGSEKAGA